MKLPGIRSKQYFLNYSYMEKLHEMDDDTIPHPIATHRRQELVEKATEIILVAEDRESLCDRMNELFQDVENGQTYPVNTFR